MLLRVEKQNKNRTVVDMLDDSGITCSNAGEGHGVVTRCPFEVGGLCS